MITKCSADGKVESNKEERLEFFLKLFISSLRFDSSKRSFALFKKRKIASDTDDDDEGERPSSTTPDEPNTEGTLQKTVSDILRMIYSKVPTLD